MTRVTRSFWETLGCVCFGAWEMCPVDAAFMLIVETFTHLCVAGESPVKKRINDKRIVGRFLSK